MAANNILMLRRREEMRAEKALQTAFKVQSYYYSSIFIDVLVATSLMVNSPIYIVM